MNTLKTRNKFDPSSVRYFSDSRHRLIAIVPLCNGRGAVTLLASDLDALIERGHGPNWYRCGNGKGRFYVATRNPQGHSASDNVTLVRLIAGAAKGERVSYLDGDSMNLRPENLVLAKAQKGKERAGTDFSDTKAGEIP
jgi:hypothetical protein